MRHYLLLSALLLVSFSTFSQTGELDERADWKDRIYVGGNLGLQFGTITNVEISPKVGYRFTNNFSAGLGVTYIYYKIKFDNYPDFETNIYGGRVFAVRNLNEQFFLYGEYESLNLEYVAISDHSIHREWVPGLFVGGGFFQPLGRKIGLSAMALYNVIYDEERSPYNSPLVLRFGISAGF